MDITRVEAYLDRTQSMGFDIYERRSEKYQLIVPMLHEDGDMVDVYLQESPRGEGYIRVCDFGLTLMRLSYTYDINTDTKRRIFESILINNGVENDGGNLYLDTSLDRLHESILQFVGCAQKVCNMRYWGREVIRSAFYDDLKAYITSDLAQFEPIADQYPIPDYPISVDWQLTHNNRDFFVFGVRGNNKAKAVTIALLEFQKANLFFMSLVVHEDMEELGTKERYYLTNNADTQYPALNEFRDRAASDIRRFAVA